MLPRQAKKAITPLVASIILLALAIAVSLATLAWLSGLSTSSAEVEELRATDHEWGPSVAYIDITLNNIGTQRVKLNSVTMNSQPATVIYIVGSNQINIGANYQFTFQTTSGNKFFYLAAAELVSPVFKMEWGTTTANDTFKMVALQHTYSNPVIVCTPAYTSGFPRTTRIASVLPNSFKVKVQNHSPSSTTS